MMIDQNILLRAKGKIIVDGNDQEVILKGVGLGGWLLPEGYMWHFTANGDRPRKIENIIERLIGPDKAEEFWDNYYNNYITEADIKRISVEGFNSIRVPINYRFLIDDLKTSDFIDKHIELLDRLVIWCRKYKVYVILDLHGAPGGQTGTNIDDSVNNKPELFTEESNILKTIELWRKLAEHYRNEGIIAGYDLLNEPLPEWFSAYYDNVIPVYSRIVKAIREVDKHHMIILEGVHWATDWSIFTNKVDDNMMLQFHKYWNTPDLASIQTYIDKRDQLDVPIFMGESGENDNDWYRVNFKLLDNMNISWNFWPWKKLETTNSPCSINLPKNWDSIVGFVNNGELPAYNCGNQILSEYLENMKFENCTYHKEVVDSVLSRIPG